MSRSRLVANGTATLGSSSVALGATTTSISGLTLIAPTMTYTVSTGYTGGSSYTPILSDTNGIIIVNNAANVSITIPTNASVPFPTGSQLNIVWLSNTGQPSISAVNSGTTSIYSTGATGIIPKLRAVNTMATAIKLGTDTWIVVGDIA